MSTPTAEISIRSFHTDFEHICSRHAQQRVLLDSKTGRVMTYGTLFENVRRFSNFLQSAGARPSDRIFSILPNSIEQLVACLAALWSGMDFCPISPLSSREETNRFVQMCQGSIGLVPHTIDRTLATELQGMSKLNSLIPMDTNGDLSSYSAAGLSRSSDDAARSGKLILFTSGTTSSPKAIVIDGDRLWSSAVAWARLHSFLDAEARFYNMLPMSYLGGLFNLGLIPLAAGASVVISEAFSAASALRFWREVEEQGVNTLWLSPTVMRSLVHLHRPVSGGRTPWKQIRMSFLGMAPVRSEEKQRFEEIFGFPLLENYALSETTFLTSEKLEDRSKRVPGSVGSVLPWVALRIQPDAATNEAAEIQVKTPFLFDGYLSSDGAIRPSLTSDGWFATGDLGLMDNGILILKGRSKDVIKKGGYLLVLQDLEDVAGSHAAVEEAIAVGMAHEFYGESATLCLRLVKDATQPREVLQEVKALIAKRLAKFKWPSEIVAVETFPKTESGKVQKQALATRLLAREGVLDSIQVH